MPVAKQVDPGKVVDRLKERNLVRLADLVCEKYAVTLYELCGRIQEAHISRARIEFWTKLHDRGWSYSSIGRLFNRDHTTVLTGIKAHRPSPPCQEHYPQQTPSVEY